MRGCGSVSIACGVSLYREHFTSDANRNFRAAEVGLLAFRVNLIKTLADFLESEVQADVH
jgi:hypothetical protein